MVVKQQDLLRDGKFDLVTRRSQRDLHEMVLDKMESGEWKDVAIVGNPGAGKSISGVYLLRRLCGGSAPDGTETADMAERKVVLWNDVQENVGTLLAFIPGEVGYEVFRSSWVASEYVLRQKDVYLIYDSGKDAGSPANVRAKTILICSTDKKHYDEFLQRHAQLCFYPNWNRREILAAWKALGGASEGEVTERMREFGCLPRFLFGPERGRRNRRRDMGLQLEDTGTIEQYVKDRTIQIASEDGRKIPTRLFAYNVSHPFADYEVEPHAQWITDHIYSKHYNSVVAHVSNQYEDPSCVRGLRFEDFCVWLLQKGGKALKQTTFAEQVKVVNLETGEEEEAKAELLFPVEERTLVSCDAGDQFSRKWDEQAGSVLLRPPEGYANIDLAGRVGDEWSGFQVTIATRHSPVKPETLPSPRPMAVYYLVPARAFKRFAVPKKGMVGGLAMYKVMIPSHVERLGD
eukprot:TRINITY_DN268_c0_g1_i7.p1 TRINITY_DN268_c0_g1~~TRINITY_DN268_c0_g1_i7.p1  ORF type:complete len:461 (+),score=73.61 TRINITY_DN268_c0_g1_i7:240-1622(+)